MTETEPEDKHRRKHIGPKTERNFFQPEPGEFIPEKTPIRWGDNCPSGEMKAEFTLDMIER